MNPEMSKDPNYLQGALQEVTRQRDANLERAVKAEAQVNILTREKANLVSAIRNKHLTDAPLVAEIRQVVREELALAV